jgi:hypothetical protein
MSGFITVEAVSMDAVSILNFEILEGIPLWLIGLFLVFILFLVMGSWIFHAEKEAKKEAHHVPSSHEIVIELQKELLKSMESTSKQNWLMIWLTILFIVITVFGGAVISNFFQNIGNFGGTWISQFIEYMKSILAK